MRFKTVFFDSGGTLYSGKSLGSSPGPEAVDAGAAKRLAHALAGFGRPVEATRLAAAVEKQKPLSREKHGRFYSYAHLIADTLRGLELNQPPEVTAVLTDIWLGPRYRDWLYPGTVETMQKLHDAGVYLGIIANTFWPGYTMRRHFDAVGLAPFWSLEVYSCDVGIDKPDPAIFKLAEARSGRRENLLYVGNSIVHDIGGAHAAGWAAAFRREDGNGCAEAEFQFDQSEDLLKIVLG
ncbi:MAG TPA: HAD family hydrolase [Planctomycetota bacterium]|nr:HAD family hydrolase [Planctomycetota bacterium]